MTNVEGADTQQVWFDYEENNAAAAADDDDDLGGDNDGAVDRWSQNNSQMVQSKRDFSIFDFRTSLAENNRKKGNKLFQSIEQSQFLKLCIWDLPQSCSST